MIAVIAVELLKARRSRVPWVTAIAFTVVALVGGLFMFILQDVDRARTMGLVGTKAALVGATADWPAHFSFLAQSTAVGGMIVFGLVQIWIFGREFARHTAKDLLALPTARVTIIAAKFAVVAAWCLVLVVQLLVLGLAIGAVLGLPGWSADVLLAGVVRVVGVALLTMLLTTPIALVACMGRGYLAGVGAMIAAVFCAQIVAALGYGQFFPWSVPALASGLAGEPESGLPGIVLVVVTGAAGAVATAWWWRQADHAD
ncbi:ABC transporter permease [Lentzea sp. CA-135723]|uniref:ABC transporter permease n=1 Tax=Lentzea sp. CA-135723 TaxID=3239950 RepID=UPI003D8A235F